MAQIAAFVQRDTRPGDALHEGHRRAAIDVRVVQTVLLNDAENADRRGMPGHAGCDQRFRHFGSVAVKVQLLLIDGNDDLQRPLRNLPEWIFRYLIGDRRLRLRFWSHL